MPSAAGEFDPERIRRLRRYTWWSIVPMPLLYAALVTASLIDGFVDGAYSVLRLVALGAVLAVLTAEATRFCMNTMRGLGQGRQHGAEQAAAFLAALLVTGYVLVTAPQYAFIWVAVPSVLAASIVANAAGRLRRPLVAATIGSTVLVVVVSCWRYGPASMLLGFALFTAVFVGFTIFALMTAVWFWDVVLELDRARSTATELAVTRERLRFASELHDVQGHHLQAIALKGELAERLVGTDDRAARAQAAETAELARTALRETREIVHGYRRSDLATELDNARQILQAAGITTTVTGQVRTISPPLQSLFGALVREGATNILRHSRARHCEITITNGAGEDRVELRNDGVCAEEPRPGAGGTGTGATDSEGGSGIEGLRTRFEPLGGRVHAEHRDGWFELSGSAEEPGGRA